MLTLGCFPGLKLFPFLQHHNNQFFPECHQNNQMIRFAAYLYHPNSSEPYKDGHVGNQYLLCNGFTKSVVEWDYSVRKSKIFKMTNTSKTFFYVFVWLTTFESTLHLPLKLLYLILLSPFPCFLSPLKIIYQHIVHLKLLSLVFRHKFSILECKVLNYECVEKCTQTWQ